MARKNLLNVTLPIVESFVLYSWFDGEGDNDGDGDGEDGDGDGDDDVTIVPVEEWKREKQQS